MFTRCAINKPEVLAALEKRSLMYETQQGRQVWAEAVSMIPGVLRDAGWCRVSRDYASSSHLREMGLEVVSAQYINGARPTGKFINVVVSADVPADKYKTF